MEIVYRAMTGTALEKIFTSEEECKRYEYLNSIKMWDWTGERTDDFSHAMVLLLPPRCEQFLRERWGDETIFDPESPFRGLLDEAGDLVCTPGFYFYDTVMLSGNELIPYYDVFKSGNTGSGFARITFIKEK